MVCPTLEFIDVCLTFVLAFRHTFTCTFSKGKMFLPHSRTADCDDSPSLAKAFAYAQRPPHTLFQLWMDCYRSNKSSVFFFGIFKAAIIQKVNISSNDLVMIFQMQKDEDPALFFLSRSRQPYVSQARPRIKKSTSTFFTFPFFNLHIQ